MNLTSQASATSQAQTVSPSCKTAITWRSPAHKSGAWGVVREKAYHPTGLYPPEQELDTSTSEAKAHRPYLSELSTFIEFVFLIPGALDMC